MSSSQPVSSSSNAAASVATRQKVLLGFTGSVAAIKAIELTRLILQFAEVKVCVTKAAAHFIDMKELRSLCDVYDDESEWYAWTKKGDTVVHIELRRWADIGLVAPLSANSLAKIATGICDNLLTSVLRAWDFNKSLIVAPAMNTLMYTHPVTAEQLQKLESWGIKVIAPVVKKLACNDTGIGALAPVPALVTAVQQALR